MKLRPNYLKLYILFIFSTALLTGCKLYRFTDASVNPNIKTFRVRTFPNLAPIQNADLSLIFTDRLKQKFLRETNLSISQGNADIEFSGAIQRYDVSTAGVSNTEETSLNRLEISVKVDFINKIETERSFSRTFRQGENYNSESNLAEVEDMLIDAIVELLVQEIFNSAFSNW